MNLVEEHRSFDGRVASIVAAVRAVVGTASEEVPLHEPQFAGQEWDFVKECLDTGWVSSAGSFVDRFEALLQDYTGTAAAVSTVNGTAALHVCLLLAGVREGDEVLLPTLTFVATANAVNYTRATPHFVDSESRTCGVDAASLSEYLQEVADMREQVCVNRRTGAVIRALVVMHAFGHPADLDALSEICTRWNITLIEDAAESLGSWYHGRHTGNFGRLAALSFNGNKVITTGGGGAVLTNDLQLAKAAKHITTTARVGHRWSFIHDQVGFNYRLPNINAALGCAQLEQLPEFLRLKRRLAQQYIDAFRGVADCKVLTEPDGCRSNYWLNTLVLDDADCRIRDAVLNALNEAGYMARPVWTLMHQLRMYSSCPRMPLHVAESLEQQLINVPSSAKLGCD